MTKSPPENPTNSIQPDGPDTDTLTELTRQISEMGGMVEHALADATSALMTLDHGLAAQVVTADRLVDDMQRQIDDTAVTIIARLRPQGSQLRHIISVIHVATDLERVGDMAKNIARRTLEIGERRPSTALYGGLRHISGLALAQVNRALDAFARRDLDMAAEVCRRDDEVD
ncbi:MAG: phosphate signaling complex protein PhoU, partial [Alphaproteobacteria bacterium]|nr:phosphate signaling complex protein PhoU [Alphaproteobacteria bacterium]